MQLASNTIAGSRRLAVWLTLFVFFAAALAPMVTHALLGSNASHSGAQICTSSGMQWVDDTPSATADAVTNKAVHLPASIAFEHCPFCLHQAGHVALPPNPLAYLFLDAGGTRVPMAWQAFFYVKDSRFWSPPRGPPALQLQV